MCDIGVFFSYTAVRTSDFEFDSPGTWVLPRGVPVALAVPPRPQRRSARSQVRRCEGASEATVH